MPPTQRKTTDTNDGPTEEPNFDNVNEETTDHDAGVKVNDDGSRTFTEVPWKGYR